MSIDSTYLSDKQIREAIKFDQENLQLEVHTDDFITYFGKNVTLEIGIKAADLELQVNRPVFIQIIFEPPQLKFDLS